MLLNFFALVLQRQIGVVTQHAQWHILLVIVLQLHVQDIALAMIIFNASHQVGAPFLYARLLTAEQLGLNDVKPK